MRRVYSIERWWLYFIVFHGILHHLYIISLQLSTRHIFHFWFFQIFFDFFFVLNSKILFVVWSHRYFYFVSSVYTYRFKATDSNIIIYTFYTIFILILFSLNIYFFQVSSLLSWNPYTSGQGISIILICTYDKWKTTTKK